MSDLIVHGGAPLIGRIEPSANKNAVLPILAATLLTKAPVRLERVPEITDAKRLLELFRAMGSRVEADFTTGVVEIEHRDTTFDARAQRLPQAMRSSILLVPPLLTRFGQARIEDEVRGCTLGVREIDPHMDVFERFGASIERSDDGWVLRAARPLQASTHWLDYASVTTTENFVLCAVLAQGRSTLTNAACEPHVQEFCRFLVGLGARIDGVGTSTLHITGVDGLVGGRHRFDEDFHEVTTFLALSAITGGDVQVKNPQPETCALIDRSLAKLGAFVVHDKGWSRVALEGGALRVREPFTRNLLQKIEAAPWPYLSADLLPIFIALGVRAEGSMLFWNKVYDGALGWTSELAKFGAHVFLSDPHRVITFGGKPLSPAEVESPYIIRVAIALLMVAASIQGRSVIRHAAPIRRAHPRFIENLVALGAQIEWREP